MKFNDFSSSWVAAVNIVDDVVTVETENKTYVMRDVTMADRLRLIEVIVANMNGEDSSVGSHVHDLMEVYETTELCEPVITRLVASKDKIYFDEYTLAWFKDGKFQYTGSAASDFFEALLKELNGTKP